MVVYSVLQFVDYEGSELLGVFGDRESAFAFASDQAVSAPAFSACSWGVVACELGQPVDVDATVEYVH